MSEFGNLEVMINGKKKKLNELDMDERYKVFVMDGDVTVPLGDNIGIDMLYNVFRGFELKENHVIYAEVEIK